MIYIEKTVIAGKAVEKKKYYSSRYQIKEVHPRAAKKNKSCIAQKKINLRLSKENLKQIINTNFSAGDIFVKLYYSSQCMPIDFEMSKKIIKNFMRKIRRNAKNNGADIKYVYVNAVCDNSFCHYLVISKNAFLYIKRFWKYGNCDFISLQEGKDFSELARYMTAPFDELIQSGEGKKWHASKKLKKPIIKKQIIL